jgi:hypothetical protein
MGNCLCRRVGEIEWGEWEREVLSKDGLENGGVYKPRLIKSSFSPLGANYCPK